MLPEGFLIRAKALLGDDYDKFIEALSLPAERGIRVNRIKADPSLCSLLLGDGITPIPYCEGGFILEDDRRLGISPEHHAGMIYAQDPGAMATLSALDLPEDAWVCDLCAAPGGKSGQIAEKIPKGFLLSNEYVPKRAKIVVGNFERLGVKNAVVTSLDTRELSEMFSCVFDLVVADAPCSGEGMFRKNELALTEWSLDNILLCQRRQEYILDNAASMVRSGGRLLYSTCTYAPEENEIVVTRFLERHPEFSIIPVKQALARATADGIRSPETDAMGIELTRRFYPHISRGEGQYIALLEKRDTGESPKILYKDTSQPVSRTERQIVDAFLLECMDNLPDGRLAKVGENIVLIPHGCPIPPKSVFMSGILLGEISGGRLKPSHQFFSAYGRLFKRRVSLTQGDARVEKYLLGEEIDADIPSGWCAVLYEGAPLGGGKASGGRVKNHYPKGLRNR